MSKSLPLILLAVLIAVSGQVTLKLGMGQVGRIDGGALAQPMQVALKVLTSPIVVAGLLLYVLGAAVWLTVLSRVPLSFAYPILALAYAVTPLAAWLLLGEMVPPIRWLGIIVILLGVSLVSRS